MKTTTNTSPGAIASIRPRTPPTASAMEKSSPRIWLIPLRRVAAAAAAATASSRRVLAGRGGLPGRGAAVGARCRRGVLAGVAGPPGPGLGGGALIRALRRGR